MIKTQIKQGLDKIGCEYNDEKLDKLLIYMDLLIEANKRTNLTSIVEPEEIVTKHFLDSLVIIPYLNNINSQSLNIMDVGTGAGFPGIPIKIIRSIDNLTLVDSTKKKVNFLLSVINNLELENIKAIHGRAEELAKDKLYREKFDVVVSRALAPLNILVELCLPFVSVGGYFIAYKSKDIMAELNDAKNAISKIGGKVNNIEEVEVPYEDIERYLLIIEKEVSTPPEFPRRPGIPQKRPIK